MLQVSFPEAFGLMGMYAHHGHTSRMFRRKGHPMGGGRHIGANHRHACHAVFRHALQYRVPVLVKLFLVHMAVGIEKRRHPMMAPSSTPSCTETSFKWSSASTAERIMPWLSMPASFAVLRLEISTTCRPTSSSGV